MMLFKKQSRSSLASSKPEQCYSQKMTPSEIVGGARSRDERYLRGSQLANNPSPPRVTQCYSVKTGKVSTIVRSASNTSLSSEAPSETASEARSEEDSSSHFSSDCELRWIEECRIGKRDITETAR